jgi:hypothetical protein
MACAQPVSNLCPKSTEFSKHKFCTSPLGEYTRAMQRARVSQARGLSIWTNYTNTLRLSSGIHDVAECLQQTWFHGWVSIPQLEHTHPPEMAGETMSCTCTMSMPKSSVRKSSGKIITTATRGVVVMRWMHSWRKLTSGQGWGQLWDICSPACCGVPMQSPEKTNQKHNLLHIWLNHPTL